jgi:type II secretory pathway predicted ATPase ExeA
MYTTYWGLRETPFGPSSAAAFRRNGPHEEGLARLHYLVDTGRRLGLLLGAAGSGKSSLLACWRAELRRGGRETALVNMLGLDARQFLWALAASLHAGPADAEMLALWRSIEDRLAEHRAQNAHTVILLDDAGEADRSALVQASRLIASAPPAEAGLTVVVAAELDQVSRLGERLIALCDLPIELAPWTADETAEFLHDSLRAAGAASPIFRPAAVRRLHELAGGVPRRVARLAELALVAGAGQSRREVDEETVETVRDELSI